MNGYYIFLIVYILSLLVYVYEWFFVPRMPKEVIVSRNKVDEYFNQIYWVVALAPIVNTIFVVGAIMMIAYVFFDFSKGD